MCVSIQNKIVLLCSFSGFNGVVCHFGVGGYRDRARNCNYLKPITLLLFLITLTLCVSLTSTVRGVMPWWDNLNQSERKGICWRWIFLLQLELTWFILFVSLEFCIFKCCCVTISLSLSLSLSDMSHLHTGSRINQREMLIPVIESIFGDWEGWLWCEVQVRTTPETLFVWFL